MKLFHYIILPVNIIVAVLFIFSSVAQFLPSAYYWQLSFLTTFFPVFFILNMLFLAYWIFFASKYILISSIALLIAFPNYKRLFSPFEREAIAPDDCQTIQLFSYNTMTLDYYKKASKNNALKFLKSIDADVMCLQEIGWKNSGEHLKKNDITNALKAYPHNKFFITQASSYGTYGIATFSKHPIVNYQRIDFGNSFNSAMVTDLKIGGDTIRLINCHLESNGLTMRDREMLNDSTTNRRIITNTLKKLRIASRIRSEQADTIASIIKSSPYPTVVCGDFNDTAFSYTYHVISNTLNDTFTGSGCGAGFTFFDHLFRFRIDYILTDKRWGYRHFRIWKEDFSDHKPISCELIIK
ncbi:MAG: endonuclease/exonuclease/phosphatase family protein [Paludibacteraceae bacterium]|nr:endonuclease/exonuclease/phosphatase family protein [Paludibacteraceae bacterium]